MMICLIVFFIPWDIFIGINSLRFNQSHGTPRRSAGTFVFRNFGNVCPTIHDRPYGQHKIFIQATKLKTRFINYIYFLKINSSTDEKIIIVNGNDKP